VLAIEACSEPLECFLSAGEDAEALHLHGQVKLGVSEDLHDDPGVRPGRRAASRRRLSLLERCQADRGQRQDGIGGLGFGFPVEQFPADALQLPPMVNFGGVHIYIGPARPRGAAEAT
jgi:hypothetical protein